MHFHKDQLEILKELFSEQQKKPNQEVFTKIMERVDPLISELIVQFSRIYYFEEPMPQLLQDAYQTAIVGLGIAIKRYDPEIHSKAIPRWILLCVRNELFRMYKVKNFDVERYLYEHPNYVEEDDTGTCLMCEEIRKIIQDLIEANRISKEEYHLMEVVHIRSMSINKILRTFGDRWGKNRSTLERKIEKVSRILKREFTRKGLGEV